jgi:hypothetical protein
VKAQIHWSLVGGLSACAEALWSEGRGVLKEPVALG